MVTITMKGPGKNALGTEMMESLVAQLGDANGAPVLLTGDGDAFSAGLNLKELASLGEEEMFRFLLLLERCMTTLWTYGGPLVAFVNGHAIAGGCIVALCCDVRVASDAANLRIGLNEVALGVRFPPRIMTIVKRRVPAAYLDEVVLGARLYSAEEARVRGLIDDVASREVAVARLDALARHPKEAYALAKHDLRGTEEDLHPARDHERTLRDAMKAWLAPAVRERLLAALTKR